MLDDLIFNLKWKLLRDDSGIGVVEVILILLVILTINRSVFIVF